MSLFFSCTVLNSVGKRQNAFLSSCVGYLATRSGRFEYSGSRGCGTGAGKFHTSARALALPNTWQPWFFILTRMIPPQESVFQFLPSAFFFSSSLHSSHPPSSFCS